MQGSFWFARLPERLYKGHVNPAIHCIHTLGFRHVQRPSVQRPRLTSNVQLGQGLEHRMATLLQLESPACNCRQLGWFHRLRLR